MPPVADGRVNATGVPTTHSWSATDGNTGGVSGTTSIVKVSVSASLADVLPSESVTLHVHVVGPPTVLGVPLILNEYALCPAAENTTTRRTTSRCRPSPKAG